MMTDSDLPDNGTATDAADQPMSFDEGVSGLADLLNDPEPDLEEPNEADDAEQPDDSDDSFQPEYEADEDGEAEDVDENVDDEGDEDGSEEPEIKGGRFAPDSAKVTLDDGTVITVADLKRNNLFQRDYTKKTTELKAEREAFETEKTSINQYAQQLDEFRQFGEWLTSQFGIQDPGPYRGAPNDPVAYLEHMQRKEQYEAIANGFNQFKAAQAQTSSQTTEQQAKAAQDRIRSEVEALHSKLPVLKDPKKNDAFWGKMKTGASEYYGIEPDLVDTIGDHRMALVLNDAIEYRRLKNAAPKATEQVKGKPRIVTGSKRGNPNAKEIRGKQQRAEQLRKTGDFDAGVKSLMDFDL